MIRQIPLTSAVLASVPIVPNASATIDTIKVPLHYVPSLSAYIVYYSVAGERFGAIVDTGSPWLMVPSYCNRQRWGCYRPETTEPSGLAPTYERFDNNEGLVEWRRAAFSFLDAEGSMIGPGVFTFGVISDSLLEGPGGVFFGLIRDTEPWIRPSFLGQARVNSFQIDFGQKDNTSLTLCNGDGTLLLENIQEVDYIPLVRDLNRRFKDPAYHYTARATSMFVNGQEVMADSKKDIFVIFDTGVSGMVVTSEIFDDRYATARMNHEKNLWGEVQINFQTNMGNHYQLEAVRPITTPFGRRPWPSFKNAHLIVVGLSFLDGHKMTIDIDKQKLWLE